MSVVDVDEDVDVDENDDEDVDADADDDGGVIEASPLIPIFAFPSTISNKQIDKNIIEAIINMIVTLFSFIIINYIVKKMI